MTWNTGARIIANGLPEGIKLLDLEDKSRQVVVPARSAVMWDGTIYPWANSDKEVREKAFLVSKVADDEGLVSLFQRFDNDTIHSYSYDQYGDGTLLLPYNTSRQIFDAIDGKGVLDRQPNIDIFIINARETREPGANIVRRVWGLRAGNDVANAEQLLKEAAAYWYTE